MSVNHIAISITKEIDAIMEFVTIRDSEREKINYKLHKVGNECITLEVSN